MHDRRKPSVLLGDVSRYGRFAVPDEPYMTNHHDTGTPPGELTFHNAWHTGNRVQHTSHGINVGYVDGHVRWINWGDVDLTRSYGGGLGEAAFSHHWPRD